MTDRRIFLSPPDVGSAEISAVVAALESGWVAPVGPAITQFERSICEYIGAGHAVALSSGSAALQLALKAMGVRAGDTVLCPTLTFAATAFAVLHMQAQPIFVDSEAISWNLDPELLEQVLEQLARQDRLPAAVITVDLFGRPCDYDALLAVTDRYEIPVLADAAEALGSRYGQTFAGTIGKAGVYSFNGNKIMTTSGGGMLVSDDGRLIDKVRHWSTQSREDFPWYEHKEVGFNYRMSNILAALGCAQLERLPEIIASHGRVVDRYRQLLGDHPGIQVVADPPWGTSNNWLATVLFTDVDRGATADRVRNALAAADVEARPIWKPMHQQPVFAGSESYLTGVADSVFAAGLCLPTGSHLADSDVETICSLILDSLVA